MFLICKGDGCPDFFEYFDNRNYGFKPRLIVNNSFVRLAGVASKEV